MEKQHYRNVFKSDHLSIYDLEDFEEKGVNLVFTVREVKQEINVQVAGRKGNFNIAYFEENIKPLVLNAVNGKQIAEFTKSGFVQDWINVPIELYVKRDVKLKGEIVGGIRIKSTQPTLLTEEQVKGIIEAAKTTAELNKYRSEIGKYNLGEIANQKANDLKASTNEN